MNNYLKEGGKEGKSIIGQISGKDSSSPQTMKKLFLKVSKFSY